MFNVLLLYSKNGWSCSGYINGYRLPFKLGYGAPNDFELLAISGIYIYIYNIYIYTYIYIYV